MIVCLGALSANGAAVGDAAAVVDSVGKFMQFTCWQPGVRKTEKKKKL